MVICVRMEEDCRLSVRIHVPAPNWNWTCTRDALETDAPSFCWPASVLASGAPNHTARAGSILKPSLLILLVRARSAPDRSMIRPPPAIEARPPCRHPAPYSPPRLGFVLIRHAKKKRDPRGVRHDSQLCGAQESLLRPARQSGWSSLSRLLSVKEAPHQRRTRHCNTLQDAALPWPCPRAHVSTS